MPMPVEANYANWIDYYVDYMKAWWDDLGRRHKAWQA